MSLDKNTLVPNIGRLCTTSCLTCAAHLKSGRASSQAKLMHCGCPWSNEISNETIQLKVFGHSIVSEQARFTKLFKWDLLTPRPPTLLHSKTFPLDPTSDNARKTGNQTGIFVFLCYMWIGLDQTRFQNTHRTSTFAFFGAEDLLSAPKKLAHGVKASSILPDRAQHLTLTRRATCRSNMQHHATCSGNDKVPQFCIARVYYDHMLDALFIRVVR